MGAAVDEEFQMEVVGDSVELQYQEVEEFTTGVGVAEVEAFQTVEEGVAEEVHQVEVFQAEDEEELQTAVEVFQRAVEEVEVFQMGVGVAWAVEVFHRAEVEVFHMVEVEYQSSSSSSSSSSSMSSS